MATSMAVDQDGSVEKRMNMSLDDIIKETSKTKKDSGPRAKGIAVGAKRGKGAPAGRPGRKSDTKPGAGRVKVVPKKFSERRQEAMAKRRGLQATGGQQARKALRPQAPIKKGAGRAPLRVQRGRPPPSSRDISNITVSIVNNRMGSSGAGNARRPIIPTAASTVAPRQQHLQQQPRYQQAPIYQQSAYSQAPAYYGGSSGRRGGGLAPLGPSMMEVAPVEYRPVRRSDPLGSEMPTYAQHDYRDGPAPNYEMEARRGGSMRADQEFSRPSSRARGPSLSAYNNTADRMQYVGSSSQRERRNARGYVIPGP